MSVRARRFDLHQPRMDLAGPVSALKGGRMTVLKMVLAHAGKPLVQGLHSRCIARSLVSQGLHDHGMAKNRAHKV